MSSRALSAHPTDHGGACCSQLTEHKTDQREDFKDVWDGINECRGKIGVLNGDFQSFRGLVWGVGICVTVATPILTTIAVALINHWR